MGGTPEPDDPAAVTRPGGADGHFFLSFFFFFCLFRASPVAYVVPRLGVKSELELELQLELELA